MPTRWTFSDYNELRRQRFLHFGRSFSSCDRPSNQSCVLGNDYHHDNDTNVYDTNDNIERYNATKSCRTYNSSFGTWASSVTWYRLQVRGAENVSVLDLTFESESESVSSCANESLSIPPFGSVPFNSTEEIIQRISDKSDYLRSNLFRFSGMFIVSSTVYLSTFLSFFLSLRFFCGFYSASA